MTHIYIGMCKVVWHYTKYLCFYTYNAKATPSFCAPCCAPLGYAFPPGISAHSYFRRKSQGGYITLDAPWERHLTPGNRAWRSHARTLSDPCIRDRLVHIYYIYNCTVFTCNIYLCSRLIKVVNFYLAYSLSSTLLQVKAS